MPDVEGDGNGTDVHPGEPADRPLGPVDGPHDVAVALSETGVPEDARRAGHDVGEVAIAPDASPEARPDEQGRPAIVDSAALGDELDQGVHRVPSLTPASATSASAANRRSVPFTSSLRGG